ncbi:MAG TPA: hypothetical protein VLK58_04385 [Conexibacter sp.]|nr:hypothetical protein [Conexibacter sp.]
MNRLPLIAPLALAATLAASAPALAGGVVTLDAETQTLLYSGDDVEPNNVTISLSRQVLHVVENGSRITGLPATCTLSRDGYRADCPLQQTTVVEPRDDRDARTTDPTRPVDPTRTVAEPRTVVWEIRRLRVVTGNAGSDVRITVDLPATIIGGDGDDLLIGGPGDDHIEGGRGKDVIGGGDGDDVLDGGSDADLLTYVDRIGRGGALSPRTTGVKVRPNVRGGSGGSGERDTLIGFEQFEGGNGNDRFELRDGRAQSIACNAGRDVVLLDPRDDAAIDCETSEVGPAGGVRMTVPTLVFPFPAREDSARSTVRVKPTLSLQGGAIVVKIRCQIAIGLLAADGPGCAGSVRMTRAGNYAMGARRIALARGRELTWRVPLTASRSLARRAGGLDVTVTAIPTRGQGVRRDLRFNVKG